MLDTNGLWFRMCPKCYNARDYKLCRTCTTCSTCCDCERITMAAIDFIASLPHGESRAAALAVYSLMTPTRNEKLVSIQPKYLERMKLHLSQYFNLLCEQAEAGEKVKEINELGLLDYVIDTLLKAHCNDTVGKIGDTL